MRGSSTQPGKTRIWFEEYFFYYSGVSKESASDATPSQFKFFHIHAIRQKICQIIGWRTPIRGWHPPPSGKSWIHHRIMLDVIRNQLSRRSSTELLKAIFTCADFVGCRALCVARFTFTTIVSFGVHTITYLSITNVRC